MSENTPTTEQVREMYHAGMFGRCSGRDCDHRPEFNEWLKFHDFDVLMGLMTGSLDTLDSAYLTTVRTKFNQELARRQRALRCQFVGEFVSRKGNGQQAQCTRRPHTDGVHTYSGMVVVENGQ